MYTLPFHYKTTESLEEALDILAQDPSQIRPLAGGQSLLAMMNLQILRPAALLDLNRIRSLEQIQYQNGWVELGALVRHRTLETDAGLREQLPLVAEAAKHIGNLRVRNRGTLGGSLAHADPASELGAVVLALDATIQAQRKGQTREIPAKEFFQGYYATVLEPDEILCAVRFPLLSDALYGFAEFVYRADDFAIAGTAVCLHMEDHRIRNARLALFGVSDRPLRVERVEQMLIGESPSLERSRELSGRLLELIQEAAQQIADDIDPVDDAKCSGRYRKQIAQVMTRRALASAFNFEY